MPSFLLRLLRSSYVRDRYLEEYNKIADLTRLEQEALVGALYIGHIGERPQVSFLSDTFKLDLGGLLQRLEKSPAGLRLVRLRGGVVETVPAIGATNILREIVPDKVIVDTVSRILAELSGTIVRDDFRRHIFSQLMRYSIIQPVIQEDKWITRFFDAASKIEHVRRQVLFWLQWSIALRERNEFVEAEKMLEQGYREAEAYEERIGRAFDYTQLDDVKAKLLMARARKRDLDTPQLFRDIRAACDIVGRLLKNTDITHHPFETMALVAALLNDKAHLLEGGLRSLAYKAFDGIYTLAERRVGNVPQGYQSYKAGEALNSAGEMVSAAKRSN